jgi:hypothetical protein
MKKFFTSRVFFIVAFSLVGFAIIVGVFKVGEFVGARRASFSYRWGENYGQNFDGMKRGMPSGPEFPQEGFLPSHGVLGQIVKIETGFLTVSSPQDPEKIVVTSEKTQVRRFRSPGSLSDLQVGDTIAVIGSPNEKGQIAAEIIRILPPPSDKSGNTTQ